MKPVLKRAFALKKCAFANCHWSGSSLAFQNDNVFSELSHFVGDRDVENLFEPLQRPRDSSSVHDPVVIEDADVYRSVFADRV